MEILTVKELINAVAKEVIKDAKEYGPEYGIKTFKDFYNAALTA